MCNRNMDSRTYGTPQKVSHFRSLFNKNKYSPVTSNNAINQKKAFHPRTPSSSVSKSFNIFPSINSPPAKRFSKVKNPFEAILLERLHLPIIGSPTLFQRPTSPHLSSTQFEWTIDEVSSLQPANLIPDETQFQDSPDPDVEAKAQSLITSYFKEQQIVPSPVDCPLRNQRIILSQINGNTPISKLANNRKLRNNAAQTILSLPSVLPKELEDSLAPYFNFNENQQQSSDCDQSSSSSLNFAQKLDISMKNDYNETKDISLRRKLFDFHNIILVDDGLQSTTMSDSEVLQGAYGSPERRQKRNDKDSFGSLSPISLSDGLSPSSGTLFTSSQSFQRDSEMNTFMENSELEQLSPIHPPQSSHHRSHKKSSSWNNSKNNKKIDKENYRCDNNITASNHTIAEFLTSDLPGHVPERRSSSPLVGGVQDNNVAYHGGRMSMDSSFNVRISRLAVNGLKTVKIVNKSQQNAMNAIDLLDLSDDLDDDAIQTSQISTNSNNSLCSNGSPRSKRRSLSRKNLSHSFSASFYDEENAAIDANEGVGQKKNLLTSTITTDIVRETATTSNSLDMPITKQDRSTFYRTDSGFNEMTSTSSQFSVLHAKHEPIIDESPQEQDISMMCCSTPSKRFPDAMMNK